VARKFWTHPARVVQPGMDSGLGETIHPLRGFGWRDYGPLAHSQRNSDGVAQNTGPATEDGACASYSD
jgi:hypothetical protein